MSKENEQVSEGSKNDYYPLEREVYERILMEVFGDLLEPTPPAVVTAAEDAINLS